MSPPRISEVVFTDPDTVRDVIHNFNRDGFDALYPRYQGGRPQTFTLPKRQEIKRIALSDPQDLGQRTRRPASLVAERRLLAGGLRCVPWRVRWLDLPGQ